MRKYLPSKNVSSLITDIQYSPQFAINKMASSASVERTSSTSEKKT